MVNDEVRKEVFDEVLDLLYDLICSGGGDGDTLRSCAQQITDNVFYIIERG